MVQLIDPVILPEEAGFWPGENSTGQIINMCQQLNWRGAVFADLTGPYDTVKEKIDPKAVQNDTRSSSHDLDSRIVVKPSVFCANGPTQKQT